MSASIAANSLHESSSSETTASKTPVSVSASTPLTRNATQPSNMGASTRQAVLQRQLSANAAIATTTASSASSSLTAYVKYLLGLSVKPTKRTLSEEAECGTPESISEWLRLGSDPNEVDAYGYTPLVNACLRLQTHRFC